MTIEISSAQIRTVLCLIAAIVLVTLAPIIVTAIYAKAVPDSLIAMADKTVTGLVGVLGTMAGIIVRNSSKAPPAEPQP